MNCAILRNVNLSSAKTIITSPSIQPVYLKSGGDLDLLCQQSDGFKVVWWKADSSGPSHDYKLLDSSSESGYVTLAHIDGMYYMRLSKANVQPSDSGSYKCSVQSGTDMPFMVDVYVLKGLQDECRHMFNHINIKTNIGRNSFCISLKQKLNRIIDVAIALIIINYYNNLSQFHMFQH